MVAQDWFIRAWITYPLHLSRFFKIKEGISPSEYINAHLVQSFTQLGWEEFAFLSLILYLILCYTFIIRTNLLILPYKLWSQRITLQI